MCRASNDVREEFPVIWDSVWRENTYVKKYARSKSAMKGERPSQICPSILKVTVMEDYGKLNLVSVI